MQNQQTATAFCQHCGGALQAGAQFCPQCGKPIQSQVITPMQQASSTQQVATSQQSAVVKKKDSPIYAIIAVLVVAGALAAAYISMRDTQQISYQSAKLNSDGANTQLRLSTKDARKQLDEIEKMVADRPILRQRVQELRGEWEAAVAEEDIQKVSEANRKISSFLEDMAEGRY